MTDYYSCWLFWAHLIHLLDPATRTTVEFEKTRAEQLSKTSLCAFPTQSQTFSSPVQPQIVSIWSVRVSTFDLHKQHLTADNSKLHRRHFGSERSCVGVTANNDTFTFETFRTKLGRFISYTVYLVATFIFESTHDGCERKLWLCVKNSAQSCGRF